MSFTDDFFAECESLRALVESVDQAGWHQPTIFYGWSIHDEVLHNHFLDLLALKAIEEPESFVALAQDSQTQSRTNPDYSFHAFTKATLGILSRDELLSRWVETYRGLAALIAARDPAEKMPWFGPPMSLEACASARQMETWAHGQDIYDMLHIRRRNEDRIRHIALLGVKTFGWSFANRQLAVPAGKPHVALTGPSGAVWTWNDPQASDRVTGSAEDFCLIVTQRRHVADTGLQVQGENANAWLRIAQCFAGDPADGPAPGVRVVQFADGTTL